MNYSLNKNIEVPDGAFALCFFLICRSNLIHNASTVFAHDVFSYVFVSCIGSAQ